MRIALACLFLVLAGCGGGKGPSPEPSPPVPQPSGIGPAGGTVSNGGAEVVVPAGALAPDRLLATSRRREVRA